jgi:hypothetical protein
MARKVRNEHASLLFYPDAFSSMRLYLRNAIDKVALPRNADILLLVTRMTLPCQRMHSSVRCKVPTITCPGHGLQRPPHSWISIVLNNTF